MIEYAFRLKHVILIEWWKNYGIIDDEIASAWQVLASSLDTFSVKNNDTFSVRQNFWSEEKNEKTEKLGRSSAVFQICYIFTKKLVLY